MFTLTYSSLTSVTACVYILLEIVFLNKNILKLFKKTQGKMSQLSIALHAFCIIACALMKNKGERDCVAATAAKETDYNRR